MGMSASQARLLSITARMNDVEFKSQSIANTKIRLADESEQIANDYTKALNKQKFTYTDYSSGTAVKVDLNSSTLANYGLTLKSRNPERAFQVINPHTGQIAGTFTTREEAEAQRFRKTRPSVPGGPNYMPGPPVPGIVTEIDKNVPTTFSSSNLYEMIESGQFYLEGDITKTTADGTETSGRGEISVTSSTAMAIENDTAELAKAEAEYNAKTAKINNKEKLLDNDLKALDTEHSALSTEFDSVKTLIGDNVEKSFNLFS